MYCTKTTKTLLGLMLAGCMGTAAAVGPGYLGTLNGQAVSVSNTINGFNVPFTDIYTFDISPAAQAIASAVKVTLTFGGSSSTPVFDIAGFAIELRDSSNIQLAYDNTFSGGSLDVAANLAAGNGYQFWVTGTTSGSAGGIYAGALAAVPEADTYAMMLAGLGLVGFMVTRRKHI